MTAVISTTVPFVALQLMSKANGKLTPKQRRFCEEYIVDLNATQAAIRAGYSSKTANSQATQILSITKVQEYLSELRLQQQDRVTVDADQVLIELAKIAFCGMGGVLESGPDGLTIKGDINKDTLDAARSISIVEQRTETSKGVTTTKRASIQLHDRIKALELLGKYLGAFTEYDQAFKTLCQYGKPEHVDGGVLFPHPFTLAHRNDNGYPK